MTKGFVDTLLKTEKEWKNKQLTRSLLGEDEQSRGKSPMKARRGHQKESDDANDVSREELRFCPFVVRNDTGTSLEYWTSTDGGKQRGAQKKLFDESESKEYKRVLLKNRCEPLEIAVDSRQGQENRMSFSEVSKTLNVRLPAFDETIRRLPVNKVGIYSIKPSISLLYSVAYKGKFNVSSSPTESLDGRSILSLHGNVVFNSECDHKLLVFLKHKTRKLSSFPLPPKQQFFIPLEWLQLGVDDVEIAITTDTAGHTVLPAYLRPSPGTKPLFLPLGLLIETIKRTAFNSHPSAFHCSPYVLTPSTFSPHLSTLRVLPPLVLQNLLPCDMKVNLVNYTTAKVVLDGITLTNGQKVPVFCENFDSQLYCLKITVDGYDWGIPVQIIFLPNALQDALSR